MRKFVAGILRNTRKAKLLAANLNPVFLWNPVARRAPFALCFFAALAIVWAAPPQQSTSLPTYWRYAYPEAHFLLGVDLASIGASPFGQKMKQEFRNAGFTAMTSKQGMDFIWSADRLLLSGSGVPTMGKGSNSSSAVAALQGKFDLPAVRKAILLQGAVRSAYKGVEMWAGGKGNDRIAMALVNPQVLLLGEREGVRAAIDNHAVALPSDSTSAIYLRAVELAAANDLWFVSEASLDNMAVDNLAGNQMFHDVESFEGGVSFKSGLALNLHFNAKSEDGAMALGTGIQGMLAIFTMGASKEKGASELLDKLKVGIAGNQVLVALNFTQRDLDRGMQQIKAGLEDKVKQSLGGSMTSINIQPAVRGQANWTLAEKQLPRNEPEPPPNQPLMVKIFNADGGTRELDINKKP
ncbi:MAG: hypothetical protein JJE04_26655 [Acidobacteriia bacterium]|nr:hypothetical protein [Terriglobia bacterium]